MRRLLAVLLGCALLLAGCAQGQTKTRRLSSIPVPSTTVSPATVVAPSSNGDLEKLMITDVPEGFKKQDDKSSSAGAFDLARAAKDDGQPEARAILQSAGFVRSYKRVWLDSGNNQVIVFVYQFHDPSGATAYRKHVTDILKQNASDPLPFTVVGIPGADGVRQSVSNADAVTITALAGPFLLLVACQAAKSDALPALATSVARAQYARL